MPKWTSLTGNETDQGVAPSLALLEAVDGGYDPLLGQTLFPGG